MLFKIFRIFYPFLILFTFFLFFFSYREYRECSESCPIEPFDFDDKNEKFLTYLPHSQFHNQLIELKNAIVLAYLTNRTLIVPSILQFNRRKLSIAHSPLYQLYNQLNYITNIKKDRLSCDVKESIYCSSDYVRYDNFVMINWEEIFDFSWIKNEIKILHRGYDFSIEGLFQICDIPINNNIKETKDFNYTIQGLLQENEDVHVISHKNKYHYKFFDTDHSYNSLGKYEVPYLISDLKNRKEKLIHIDTLFGSSKINFNDKRVIKWKFDMNKSLKFSHPILLDVANSIINELGGFGNFVGAHVRTGDGIFRKNMKKIIDLVIENLKILCDSTKKSIDESDESFNTGNTVNLSLDNCKLQNKQIIFIATDSKDPRKQLKTIFSTFPCIFTIENFKNLVDPLKNTTFVFDKNSNTMDFFYPLLDLLIIANGLDVVVTHDSTFSGFAKYYHQILTLNSF